MFATSGQNKAHEILPGVFMKVLTFGDNSLLCEFQLKKNAVIPIHQHPQEQSGYMVSGKMRFTGEDELVVQPGSGWNFKGGVSHGVEVLEDSVVIEIFSPIRQDYLELAGIHL